jgi:hypothetical protein
MVFLSGDDLQLPTWLVAIFVIGWTHPNPQILMSRLVEG